MKKFHGSVEKVEMRACIMLFFAVSFYFYEFMIQVSPGVMAKSLMSDFNINATSLGNLSAYFFYSYALMQLVVGVILDRWGPRRLLVASSIVCAIGCYLFSQSTELLHAEMSRLIIGIGSASAVISCFKLATAWFPPRIFGIITGLTVMTGMLGAIFGEGPLSWVTEQIGWRSTMLGFAVLGCGLAFLIWSIVRDRPEGSEELHPKHTYDLKISIATVLSCRQTWLTSIYGGLMFAPTTALGALWGVSWMISYYHLDQTTAANIVSFLFFGWVVGSPLSGVLTNYFGRCKVTMYIGTTMAFVAMCLLIFVHSWSLTALSILWFSFGLFSAGFLPFMTIIRNQHNYHHLGTAMGFGNAMNMVGGALLQPFIGWLLDLQWKGQMVDNVRHYVPESYMYALIVIPVFILVAFGLLLLIKENNLREGEWEKKQSPLWKFFGFKNI